MASLYLHSSLKSKKDQRYEALGFSMETAMPKSAAHSARSKVLRATKFAVFVNFARPGMPCGCFSDLRRVLQDRSRAREKVEHGGAK